MIKQYLKPQTVSDALALKAQFGEKAAYIAGGSKINAVPTRTSCETVIALGDLQLNQISAEGESRRIGATMTIQSMCDSELLPESFRKVTRFIYSRHIRNQATLGGEIVAKQQENHLLPALIAWQAELELGTGERCDLETYLAKEKKDLIVAVRLPDVTRSLCSTKICQSADSWAVMTAAVSMSDEGAYRIAVAGLEPKVVRLKEIEDLQLEGDALEKAVARAVKPCTDIRGSEEYKRYIAGVVIADLVDECKLGGH